MRSKPSRLVNVALAIVAIATLAVMLTGRDKARRQTEAAVQTSTIAQTTTATQTTSRSDEGGPAGLNRQVVAFLKAYYIIMPGDTAAGRRRRVAPYVSKRLLARLGFGANRVPGLIGGSRVRIDQLAVSQAIDSNTWLVSVPVAVYSQRAGSPTTRYITLQTQSRWSYRSGRWTIISFDLGGG